jgi:hypothetical protein
MPLDHDNEKLLVQLQRGGEALYFSHCKSSETWLPLIEKAYAKAHGDYFAIEGGFASEAIEDLTGGVGVVINPEDIMDKERFWREQLSHVNEKYLFGGGTKMSATKGFVGGHAYAVLKHFEEGDLKLLKIRNPWGEKEWEGDWADGSRQWTPEMMRKLDHTFGDDGVFWMTYKDFLKHFPAINRVRLFNKEWQVAQQWTSVNVPWTVEYLDTKFQFTIEKKCPVVIVLMQPDDRYFYGLSGRFCYSLHFRVYKEGEEGRWIVRSMHNSGGETLFTRSVSAEIEDLEPGTYSVVFKVTAVRADEGQTNQEGVLKYAVSRKDKLLSVGRRYDYAQTKGNLRAMEELNRRRGVLGRREDLKVQLKLGRKLKQKEREREKKRKKRVDDAMRERRKEYEEKRRAREMARRRRRDERGDAESMEAQGGSDERSEEKEEATPAESPSKEDAPDAEAGAEEKGADTDGGEKKGEEAAGETTAISEETDGMVEEEGKKPQSDDEVETAAEGTAAEGEAATEADELSKDLSKLQIDKASGSASNKSDPMSPLSDDMYDSPLDEPEELADEDFEWDSDM